MKKINLTVGIPAYNEEANIIFVLQDLLSQKETSFVLRKIIIVSDGSIDKTVQKIKQLKDERILLIQNKTRQGIAVVQNQLLAIAESDIVALVQADVSITDKLFLNKLIQPIIDGTADLTAAKIVELSPKSALEKAICLSMQFKKYIYEHIKQGNNIYTCFGPSRAFSKKLYPKIQFKKNSGEDAYSYLFTISNGFKYQYVSQAKVMYKLPDTLQDHLKQSLRFSKSRILLEKEFGSELVKKEYMLPVGLSLFALIKYGFKQPVSMLLYLIVTLLIKFKTVGVSNLSDTWSVAASSKILKGGTI